MTSKKKIKPHGEELDETMRLTSLWKKSTILNLHERWGKKIKKSLSQNYLADRHTVEKITSRLIELGKDRVTYKESSQKNLVIEIGPGLGVMSESLLKQDLFSFYFNHMLLIELDEISVKILEENFYQEINQGKIKLIHQDILTWGDTLSQPCLFWGNLPYQISSKIIFRLCEDWYPFVSSALLMVQKEVGERLRAKPNTASYGISTVIVNYFFSVKKVIPVKRASFFPVPQVDSEVIELLPLDHVAEKKDILLNYIDFKTLVKAVFHNRRKQIANSVVNYVHSIGKSQSQPFSAFTSNHFDLNRFLNCLEQLNLSPHCRAENLTVDELVKLSNLYSANPTFR